MKFAHTCRSACPAVMAAGLLLAGAAPAFANIIVDHNWDSGSHGWTSEFNDVSLTVQAAGGNPDGWLQVTFAPTAAPEILKDEWVDIVRVDTANLFAGNWAENLSVQFDFFAADRLPQDLQLQFHSTNDNVWGYSIAGQVTQTQTWSTIQAALGFSAGWGPLPGFNDTEEQFLADLSSIDWIGVYIFRDAAGSESYGIDNFRLLVPEPGEFAMLFAVVLACAWAYRRQANEPAVEPSG